MSFGLLNKYVMSLCSSSIVVVVVVVVVVLVVVVLVVIIIGPRTNTGHEDCKAQFTRSAVS